MKTFIFTLTSFLLVSTQLIAQQKNTAIYKTKMFTTADETKSTNPIVQQMMLSFSENTDKDEYTLIFNRTKSYFSLIEDKDLKIGNQTEMGKLHLFTYKVYTDLIDNLMIKQPEPFEKEIFLIKTEIGNQQWELTTDSKLVDGHKCYKAILKKDDNQKHNVVAWYAPDIPFRFGPIVYNNLPGLILELTLDERIIIYLTQLNLNSKEDFKFKIPENGKIVNEAQYEEESKKYTQKMLKLFEN